MTEEWDCAEARVSLGVYVLGAIDPAERALVDAHVADCRDCRDELAGLAGIPALLARVNPEEIERIGAEQTAAVNDQVPVQDQPPPELIGTVLDLAAARRRRNRWRSAAAAAAVAALAGGVFGGLAATGPRPASPAAAAVSPGNTDWETATATSKTGDVKATVSYGAERWGTVLEAKVEGIPLGTTCELWVTHRDGTRTLVTSWTTADDEGAVWYPGAISMPNTSKGINSFQITAGKKLLVTVHPT